MIFSVLRNFSLDGHARRAFLCIRQTGCGGWQPAKYQQAGDLMKTYLLSAAAASTLLASVSLTFAQSTAAEAVEQSQAMQDSAWSARRKMRTHEAKPEPTTIGTVLSKIFSPAKAETGSSTASVRRSRAGNKSLAASSNVSSVASSNSSSATSSGGRPYDAMIASHAAANGVPAELVHRIVMRESRYHPQLVGRGGASGLMQIKLATARGMGYTGSAAGLLDPETNLTYGVKYLAGAYRTAGGNHTRAVGYYASGYYYAAKRQRVTSNAYAEAAQPASMMATSDATGESNVTQREVRRKKHQR